MRVHYKGKSKDYQYRIAEILFEDSEKEKIEKVVELLEKEGWKIDTAVWGFFICEVEDRSEYDDFVLDWKKAKKEAAV